MQDTRFIILHPVSCTRFPLLLFLADGYFRRVDIPNYRGGGELAVHNSEMRRLALF
jgi:hypothetical protein